MKLAKTNKVSILLLLGVIFFLCATAGPALASVAWLSSIPGQAPAGVAVDNQGNVYVTQTATVNSLYKYDRRGNMVRALNGLSNPIAVAVDGSNRVYIGSGDKGSVSVYNPDLSFAFKLGKGDGEFKFPASIAVSAKGLVFVSDRDDYKVKAYALDGTPAFSFGTAGSGDKQFNRPLGIAVDDNAGNATGEIYVVDSPLLPDSTNNNILMQGARVQAFDLSGAFVRSFGQLFGTSSGQMQRPVGIAADGAGMVYVTDTFWNPASAVHVFTEAGAWVQDIADPSHDLKTPLGIAVSKDSKLFVASLRGPSVEIFGLDGYTTFAVSPDSLTFAAQAGSNPPAQALTVTNSGPGTLTWTATSDSGWLKPQSSGSTGPATNGISPLAVSIDTKGLGAGDYIGIVTAAAASGAQDKIEVSLTVKAPPSILSVTPSSLGFKAQQSGLSPQAQALSIRNIGSGDMPWTASASQPWINLSAISANNPSSLTVTLDTSSLPAGTQTGSITISASGAQGSPLSIPVNVQVVYGGTIKVSSNLPSAAFDITGAATYNGAGASWSNDSVTPGDYTINFKRVAGYFKPATRTFTIKTGQEVDLSGEYRKIPKATHVIAAPAFFNPNSQAVALLTTDGKPEFSFTPFTDFDSVRVAAGDLDGTVADDGTPLDKVVVTDYRSTVKVYTAQGVQLASADLGAGWTHADVTVGDLDNDGKAEILVSADNSLPGMKQPQRIIKIYSYTAGALLEKATLYTEDKAGSFSMALGDINDDGLLELVLADATSIRAFKIQQSQTGMALAQIGQPRYGDYGQASQIAIGDMNGDGLSAEIAVSYETTKETRGQGRGSNRTSTISIMKGTLEDSGIPAILAFKDLGYALPSTLSMGDITGDGICELVAGAGRAGNNDPLVRIYGNDGTYAGITMKPMDGKYGVNVGLGKFQ